VAFFTAGYPSLKATEDFVETSVDGGADMIELGIPFSDPLADGPQVQLSSKAALDKGITLAKILTLVEKLRSRTDVPLILMGYVNPILAYGFKRFYKDCDSAGVDGLIIPDLPVDEASEHIAGCRKANLSTIFLASPTTSSARIKQINRASSDFVYAVTVTGVTGTGKKFDRSTDNYLKGLRRSLTKPFLAGFGVSDPVSARRLTKYAAGVVIGSALVKIIAESNNQTSARQSVERFLSQIRKAI